MNLVGPGHGELRRALDRAGLRHATPFRGRLDALRHWADEGLGRRDRLMGNRLKRFIDTYSGSPDQLVALRRS